MAYGGKKTDNNCKIIYLVNPSADSIYYIGKIKEKDISECQTYYIEQAIESEKYSIAMSKGEEAYQLLLPKDTIVYKIIIPADKDRESKELLLQSRYGPVVINTNEDRKRNRKIKRLKEVVLAVPIIE